MRFVFLVLGYKAGAHLSLKNRSLIDRVGTLSQVVELAEEVLEETRGGLNYDVDQ